MKPRGLYLIYQIQFYDYFDILKQDMELWIVYSVFYNQWQTTSSQIYSHVIRNGGDRVYGK